MYYPLLRGKQFELKALREFSDEHPNASCIIPVIEPVNANYNPLCAAVQKLIENQIHFALILNPKEGDFKHIRFDVANNIPILGEQSDEWLPAYIFKNNTEELNEAINESASQNIMLVFKNPIDFTEDASVQTLVQNHKVSHIVFNNDNSMSRRSKSFLRSLGKCIIGLNDCFNEKPRNVDYIGEEDEFFSEMPFYYLEDQLQGFSDYTALSSKYIEGGMMPYALAIHLTYKKNSDSIHIHHFVSDSNRTRADIRGKFNEAAQKILHYYQDNGITITTAVQDIMNRVNGGEGYPGLGYLKKLSILNHMELVYNILQSDVNQ